MAPFRRGAIAVGAWEVTEGASGYDYGVFGERA
jgi:hypothetical protein